MNIIGAIDLASFVDVRVRGESLFHKTAHLLFVVGVPFDCFYDQTVSGTPRLLGKATEPGAQFPCPKAVIGQRPLRLQWPLPRRIHVDELIE